MKSLRLGTGLFALIVLIGAFSTACSRHYVVVTPPPDGYSKRDTLYGRLDGSGREIRVTFWFDTIFRTDTVVQLDTLWEEGARVDTVRLTNTVTVIQTDTVTRADTIMVSATDTRARVDTVTLTVTDTVNRVDTVTVTNTVTNTVTDTVMVTDTVWQASNVQPRPNQQPTRVDTVLVTDTLTRVDTVRVTNTVVRTDTVTRVDTVQASGRDLGAVDTRVDTVRVTTTDTVTQVDTVRVATTDTVMRVDTVSVTDTVTRVDTVSVATTDTVTRVDTVSVTNTVTRVDTIRVATTDTVRQVDTLEVAVTDTVLQVDTVQVTRVDTVTVTVNTNGPRSLFIPPGQYPREGQCRVWIPGDPPGRQPDPADCDDLGDIPTGAFILFSGTAWDADWDWVRQSRESPGAIPPEIVGVTRRGRGGR